MVIFSAGGRPAGIIAQIQLGIVTSAEIGHMLYQIGIGGRGCSGRGGLCCLSGLRGRISIALCHDLKYLVLEHLNDDERVDLLGKLWLFGFTADLAAFFSSF